MRYELIDHTADLMVKAHGSTLEECFGNAAFAIFDQTVDLSGIGVRETTEVRVTGTDDEDRLFSFLSEMLYIEDAENLVLKEFDVSFQGDDVICIARGERLDRARHRTKSEIKAVTYHKMRIDRDEPSVTVLFDVRSAASRDNSINPLHHRVVDAQIGLVLHRKGPRLPQSAESRHGP